MKIFVLSDVYSGNGASEMLLNVTHYWVNTLGWQVDAIVRKDIKEIEYNKVMRSGMRPVLMANFRDNYDLALVNCIQNIAFVDVIYPRVPIVLWGHEAETILDTTQCSTQDWIKFFSKISMVIFQTDWQKKLYGQFILDSDKVRIIPNGIPPIGFDGKVSKSEGFKISTVGRISPSKNQLGLIEAVCRLINRYQLTCDFIGDNSLMTNSKNNISKLVDKYPDTFKFLGHLERNQALARVAGSDLFCFPSRSESFGLAPLEASSLGVPVILNDLPVYRNLGWKSDVNCMMFNQSEPHSLDRIIEYLINHPEKRTDLSEQGRKLAGKFNNISFMEEFSLLFSILSSKNGRFP